MFKVYNDDFCVVGGNNLVDVLRHIVVMEGSLDIEANGVQIFHVYFDPEINRDRLTMRQREAPHYVEPRFPIPNFDPDAETIFYSMKRTKLFEFYFSWQVRADGRLPMLLKFPRSLSLIIDKLGLYVKADVAKYLQQIVSAAFDIYDVPSGTSDVAELVLLARRDIADVLYPDQASTEAGEPVLLFSKKVA